MKELINRNSPIPMYYQLQEVIRDQIDDGLWQPGDLLPTEDELCLKYEISKITVRNALRQLALEGLIERTRGKGTVVKEPKVSDLILHSLTGTYHSGYPEGTVISTQVIEKSICLPPEIVRTALSLTPEQETSLLVRIRSINEVPLFWTRAYVPVHLCPNLLEENFKTQSFYEIIENKYGLITHRSVRTIATVLATSRAVNYLGVDPGQPLNIVESTSYLEDGTPLEYSRTYYRGDRVKFEVVIE